MKVYQFLAQCAVSDNICCMDMATQFVEQYGPSGSGFDCGTELISAGRYELELKSSYHHMDNMGMYTHWSNYTIKVKGNLLWGFDIEVIGDEDDDTKGYIAETFDDFLNSETNRYMPNCYPNFINATWGNVK